MRTLSAPGGRIAIMGPNFRYCAADYFDCADHTLALSDVSVAEHLHTAGYRVTSLTRASSRSRSAAACRRRRGSSARTSPSPLAWRLIGKQFLVVGER